MSYCSFKKVKKMTKNIDVREYIDCSLARPLALFWLSCYVVSRCLAVAPQSGAKQNFHGTVYYITLNSNFEAQRASKNLKTIVNALFLAFKLYV
jgi:hypothetical protein